MDINEFGKMFDTQMEETNKNLEKEAFTSLHNMFKGLTEAGFTDAQAMELISTMIETALKNSCIGNSR